MKDQKAAIGSQRLDIMWVELILIALLVLGEMGVWLVVEPRVAARMQGQAPSEAQSQQDAGVPAEEAQVDLVKEELTQVQAALVKERMSVAEQNAQMTMLAAQNPQLTALLAPAMEGIPLSQATVKSLLDAHTKLSTATSLASTLEKRLNDLVEVSVTLTATLNSLPENTSQRMTAQAQLNMTGQELDQVQTELVTQRMEVTRQQASIQSLMENYPQLLPLNSSGDGNQGVSMPLIDALSRYLELAAQKLQSDEMITALESRQNLAVQQLGVRNSELLQAQTQAKQKLEQAMEDYRMAVRRSTLLEAGLWSLVSLLIVWVFLVLTHRLHTYPLRPLGIVLITLGLTAILYCYQAFEYLGGAIAGVVLLMAGLLWLSAYKRKMEAQAAKEKDEQKAKATTEQATPEAAQDKPVDSPPSQEKGEAVL
jgi:hypothetical protein